MMAVADNRRRDDYLQTIDFEETELRLGLPGGTAVGVGNEGADENLANGVRNVGKRGFSETESSTATNDIDLKLNLSTKMESGVETADQTSAAADHRPQLPRASNNNNDPAKPPAPKAQVVGWPPVRSYRKNLMSTAAQKTTTTPASTSDEKKTTENNAAGGSGSTGASFVKVSLDGAPYLRKVDLKLYRSYNQLAEALGKMFSSFSTVDNCGSQGTKDFMKEGKSIDLLNGSEYVPTYEDKDGDWMLVGDIPWGVFVDSCKRLRIMKGSEAIGLAPRAVEKCKS